MATTRRHIRRWLSMLAAAVLGAGLLAWGGGSANAAEEPGGRLMSEVPSANTPHVLDGGVYTIARVGNTIVVGGSFTQARNPDSNTVLSRSRLLAFDAATGQIRTNFTPNPNGVVNAVIPAGDGQSVYVGGSFTTIAGTSAKNLVRLRVSDGGLMTSFNGGSPTGAVKDLHIARGQLWVAGAFTHIHGKAQRALATLNPQTGAFSEFFRGKIAGTHRGNYPGVAKIDVSAEAGRLVAIGNFDTLDEVKNHQLLVLDIDGPTATSSDFRTKFYEAPCSSAFDSYMRDVDVSPDGSFFVVSTTGAYGGSTGPCDTTARFEMDASGANVEPSWINYTGGDTTIGVEVTEDAVYVGGHQRWQNNPFAGDRPGPGAVERPGIAALSPVNGLPFSWNPTRTRGVGVYDFLHTGDGLYVTSDTDRFGRGYHYRGRIAHVTKTGTQIPAISTPELPNDVFQIGLRGQASDPRVLYRVNAAGPALGASRGIDWEADTTGSPSPYHNGSSNRESWSAVPQVDATVPAGTPRQVFDSELWDPAGGAEQHWSFPVEAGVPLQVRLYFANRCTCTQQVGQRVFDVRIDGSTVLDDFDIVRAVGHDVGTMRAFDITSDGVVDIDLGHVVENPLVNAIEIIRRDIPESAPTGLTKRTFDGAESGASLPVPTSGIDWDQVRGSFMINGQVYLALQDGTFVRRSFNGTTFGSPAPVATQDELIVLQDWKNDITASTGMFYDFGRIYFTVAGSNQLFYRYFNPESGVVGAKRLVASDSIPGLNFASVRGMFLGSGRLYWSDTDGRLRSVAWADGPQSGRPVAGTVTEIDGPAWNAKSYFLYQDAAGDGAELPPVARFATDCTSRTCSFDASDSLSSGSEITAYEWKFGDGTTGTGRTVQHAYGADGDYSVELTVRTAKGGVANTVQTVSVIRQNQPPQAAFTYACDERVCTFDSSTSTDDEGIASRTWDFGDGAGPQPGGVTASHTFSEVGTYEVTLTVTDTDGAVDQVTREVEVSDAPAPSVTPVAAQSTNGNRINHTVRIPDDVQAGDRLLLFMTANSSGPSISAPAGWTQLATTDASGAQGRAWTKIASASDAGSTVTVVTTAYAKSDLSVVAYRGSAGTPTVDSVADTSDRGTASALSPVVNIGASSWLVNYWGVKSSSDTTISLPPNQTERTASAGSGGGGIFARTTDSDGFVNPGQVGGQEVTLDPSVNRVIVYAVVLGAH